MTQEEAQAVVDILNANPVAGITSVVGETINRSSYELSYDAINVTTGVVAAYGAADILTKAKYGQSFVYAMFQTSLGGDFITQFDLKLAELLG